MPKYRNALPQMDGGIFLSDGGMETTLIFHEGWSCRISLRSFCSTPRPAGSSSRRYYEQLSGDRARQHGVGFVLDSATWRANPDWGAKLGYDAERAEGDQRCVDRAARRASRRMGNARHALRHQRRDRAARRRLQGRQHGC